MSKLILDFETTSLDFDVLKIIELAYAVIDDDDNIICTKSFLINPKEEISEEIEALCGISNKMLRLNGLSIDIVKSNFLQDVCLYHVDKIIAHNAYQFDKKVYEKFNFPITCHWLDTMTDINYPPHIKTRKLSYLAYEHGYVLTGSHRAINDVLACHHLVKFYSVSSMIEYKNEKNIKIILQNIKKPWLGGEEEINFIKSLGFRFDGYSKSWYMILKEKKVDSILKNEEFVFRGILYKLEEYKNE